MSFKNNKDAELGYGVGEVDPVKAFHPCLIYDAKEENFIRLLCGHGITTTALRLIKEEDSNFSKITSSLLEI